MRILLECHLHHPTHGLKSAGMAITHNGSTVLLFATFSVLFGDWDSLKLVLEIKRGGGVRPCFKCLNIWNKGTNMAHRKAGHAEISVCSKSALQLYTCRSFKTVVRDLQDAKRQWQAGTMAKGLYTDLCKACGFDVPPYGVWSSPRLVDNMFLPESMLYDWGHTL